jgi:hypothetical protein
MISKLICDDLSEEYFDEIDISSSSTKKISCAHYEIEIKIKSDNFKFQNYCISIVCKKCKYKFKNVYKKNKDDINYCCDNCNPQSTINFSYKNTMENDNDNDNEINNIPIEDNIEEKEKEKEIINNKNYYGNNFEINGNNEHLINNGVYKRKIKTYHTPDNNDEYSLINENKNKKEKIYRTPDNDDEYSIRNKNNSNKGKVNYAPNSSQKQKNQQILIKFQFHNKILEEEFNYFESLEKQCYKIKEDFGIQRGKNIELYENSEALDKNKSPQDLDLKDGMIIEIETNNSN